MTGQVQGQQFGVDINQLYIVALDMNNIVDNIYGPAVAQLSGIAVSSVVAPWLTLQEQLIDALNTAVKNLSDSSATLQRAANDYAATDQQAAATFNQLRPTDRPDDVNGQA